MWENFSTQQNAHTERLLEKDNFVHALKTELSDLKFLYQTVQSEVESLTKKNKFLQLELTSSTNRLNIFEVKNISLFKELNDNEELNKINNDKEKIIEIEMLSLENQLRTSEKQITLLQSECSDLKQTLRDEIQKKKEVEQQLNKEIELNVMRCTEINVRNQQIVSMEAIELDLQTTHKRNYNLEIAVTDLKTEICDLQSQIIENKLQKDIFQFFF